MPVALTIVFALAGSLVLSLTIIPVLASYLLREVKHEDPWLPRKLLALYEPALAWGLRRQRVVGATAVLMLLAAGLIYTQVGKTFMPTMDEGDLIVGIEKLPSISLEQSAALCSRLTVGSFSMPTIRSPSSIVGMKVLPTWV